jgi:adenylate cyclase
VFIESTQPTELTTPQAEDRARFTEALATYRAKQWETTRRGFAEALVVVPNDGPSLTLLKRLDTLQTANLAEDWDGAWHLDQK